MLGIDTVDPIVGRGVLLDVAALHGVECLAPAHEVTGDELEGAERSAGVEVREGDSVLIRTGWSAHWDDPDLFRGQAGGAPGPGSEAARWLVERHVRLVGGETIAFEVIRPGAGHATPARTPRPARRGGDLYRRGDDLTELAAVGAVEFVLVVAPLKIVGGTGSPIRPIALVDA